MWDGLFSEGTLPDVEVLGFPIGAGLTTCQGQQVLWRPGYHSRRVVKKDGIFLLK